MGFRHAPGLEDIERAKDHQGRADAQSCDQCVRQPGHQYGGDQCTGETYPQYGAPRLMPLGKAQREHQHQPQDYPKEGIRFNDVQMLHRFIVHGVLSREVKNISRGDGEANKNGGIGAKASVAILTLFVYDRILLLVFSRLFP
ncbi:hypothetical protein [Pseudoduganella rivuli]|uniref:hypothetical protein n=1 Tax=Pseudoduganella rivuli TaxID=2666085 RepID=UPI001E5806F8|nr:hypothetical protein [Pseudoduganella rivuli]